MIKGRGSNNTGNNSIRNNNVSNNNVSHDNGNISEKKVIMDPKKVFYRHLPKLPSECAFYLNKSICSNQRTLEKMKEFLEKISGEGSAVSDDKEVVKMVAKKLDCNSESCIMARKSFKEFAGKDIIDNNMKNFKPKGTETKFGLLSNFNIDDVIDQWDKMEKGKFLHIEFQMRDFEKVKSRLATINLADEIRKGKKYFGVVLNTDYSTGGGIHWFCLFGDFRKEPYTIEYFNSSGNNPLPEVQEWMVKTKSNLENELNKQVNNVIATRLEHQKDDHSCGPYSLYYIWCRIHNIPWQFFKDNRVPDELMHEYRKHLFRFYN